MRAKFIVIFSAAQASALVTTADKHAIRFRAMLENFSAHDRTAIDNVKDARLREQLHSVHAAIEDEKVVEAFCILYEDLPPLRVGGDLLFRRLTDAVHRSAQEPCAELLDDGDTDHDHDASVCAAVCVIERPESRAARRFDSMCAEFSVWAADETILARAVAKNPRYGKVLDGCFAGAQNDIVVRALSQLYEDYVLLRLGGDLIFKLMRRLVRASD